jgi:hypothetical protein
MRHLHTLFPAAVPTPVLDHLERANHRPRGERRGWVRLPGGPANVRLRPRPLGRAGVLDYSPKGLLLRIRQPSEPGQIRMVRWPAPGGPRTWYPVQVRHWRKDGEGWVVGCEFVGTRSPTA